MSIQGPAAKAVRLYEERIQSLLALQNPMRKILESLMSTDGKYIAELLKGY